MKLTFKKHEVRDLAHLRELVAQNADAIEPGLQVIAQSLSLGRATVDLVGLDARRTPVFIGLGLVADDQTIFRMLEAYAWSLEYPEALRRLAPAAEGEVAWPPRVVFVGGRVLDSFLRKIGLFNFPSVDCFEFRCVDVNGATGFYLDAVDCGKGVSAVPTPAAPHSAPAGGPARERPETPGVEPLWASRDPRAEASANGRPRSELQADPRKRIGGPGPSSEVGGSAAVSEPHRDPRPAERVEDEPIPALGAADRPAVAPRPERPATPEGGPTWRKFLERLAATLENQPVHDDDGAPTPSSVTGESPPEPPAAVEPPTGVVVAAPRGLLDGVTLPANVDLAPQWRRFLDGPVFDEVKIGVVREYLQREFPLCTIYDFHEYQRGGQVFQLQDVQGNVSQLATITADFFAARDDDELRLWLEKNQLGQALRQAGQTGVVVTEAGIQAAKR